MKWVPGDLVYRLARESLKCNSLVQKICMFLQKKTSHCQNSLGPKHYIFGSHFYSKNARKLKFHVFVLFYARKHMILSFYLEWTEFTRNCEFFPFVGPLGPELNWNKFTISCEFGTLQVKWWHHMFSSTKMEEYMESEFSGIFWVKLIAKDIVLGSSGTHFMHRRVKVFLCLREFL